VCEEPTRPGFWARVAAHVPGKSAADCFNRLYDAVPTPAPPAARAHHRERCTRPGRCPAPWPPARLRARPQGPPSAGSSDDHAGLRPSTAQRTGWVRAERRAAAPPAAPSGARPARTASCAAARAQKARSSAAALRAGAPGAPTRRHALLPALRARPGRAAERALRARAGRARRAPAATRKFARAARRQELAANTAGAAPTPDGAAPEPGGGTRPATALDRLVEVMRRQERTDKCAAAGLGYRSGVLLVQVRPAQPCSQPPGLCLQSV